MECCWPPDRRDSQTVKNFDIVIQYNKLELCNIRHYNTTEKFL